MNKRYIALAITIVALLSLVFVFRNKIFAPKPVENVVFVWSDVSGQQYVTTQTKEVLAPDKIYPNHPTVKLVKLDGIKTPLKDKAGFITATYKLADETEAVYSLSDNGGRRTIFLIGETHLGKSQKAVAKKIVTLINTYEIDAIFIEQPETLKFNWSEYETLSSQPDKAIAALQERMIKDADRPMSLELGKYKVYFDNAKPKTREEVISVVEKIYNDHGEEAAKEVISMLNKLPDVSETNKLYEESKYISAADYLYVMLNLKGIKLPFHNIESVALRAKFSDSLSTSNPNLDTTERDTHMVAAATKIAQSNNYRRIILICGAKHLDTLKQMFSKKNYDVKVEYNSLSTGEFKVEMATLKNPGFVKEIASSGPSSGFVPSGDFIVEKAPSKQIMDVVDKYLNANANSIYSAGEITGIKDKFIEAYKARGLKGKQSWAITITEGNQSINISKSATDDNVRVKAEPLSALNKEMASAPIPKDDKMKLAYQTYDSNLDKLAKETNKQISSSPCDIKFPYYIVEQYPSMHMLYDGKGISEDSYTVSFKTSDIIDRVIKDTQTTERKEVYLVLKNYTQEQADGVAVTARKWLKKQGISNIKIRTVLHPESPLTRDFFETVVGIEEVSEEPVQVTTGKYKGLFKSFVKFFTRDGRKLRMDFYTETKLLGVSLIQHLKSYVSPGSLWNMNVMKGTQAELAAKIRIALETDKHFKDDNLKMVAENETSDFRIVIITIENQKEG
ncbi:MAG: hypothetical protein HQL05_13660 [Nitrospirae bacterium]|uniref:hypothetical protein n=1 Tax=Candidatus Magnetobacterium casense TaxID=1455061 RepID=UPI00058B35AC|nr:hypothetical protein [Candidatus Magnetobacterium casensis]MBF0338862.1 hypothetical protein [Nitrospirota bacterium]